MIQLLDLGLGLFSSAHHPPGSLHPINPPQRQPQMKKIHFYTRSTPTRAAGDQETEETLLQVLDRVDMAF